VVRDHSSARRIIFAPKSDGRSRSRLPDELIASWLEKTGNDRRAAAKALGTSAAKLAMRVLHCDDESPLLRFRLLTPEQAARLSNEHLAEAIHSHDQDRERAARALRITLLYLGKRIRSSQLDSPLRRWVPPRYRDDSELAVALEHVDGHRHDAAEALNVSQPILRRRIRAAAPGTPLHRYIEHKGQQARRHHSPEEMAAALSLHSGNRRAAGRELGSAALGSAAA